MSFTGDPVTALDTSGDTQDAIGTTASLTYTSTLAGGVACGIAFIAPASGKVIIHNSLYFFNTGAGHSFGTIRVRTGGTIGAGVDVLPEADVRGLITSAVNAATRSTLVTGLTPGNTYNVQGRYRVDANSAQYSGKDMIVEPQV